MSNYTKTLVAAFVQVNTVRGNRYIDDAGQIVNDWEDSFPQWEMSVQGMKMINPRAAMRELSVDTKKIWVHFEEPESLHEVSRQSRRVIDSVSHTIGVDTFNRLALRVQYLVTYPDNPNFPYGVYRNVFSPSISKLIAEKSLDEKFGFEMVLLLQEDDLNITLRVAPVRKSDDTVQEDLPTIGVMFDADVHVNGITRLPLIGSFFRDVEKWTHQKLTDTIALVIEENHRDR